MAAATGLWPEDSLAEVFTAFGSKRLGQLVVGRRARRSSIPGEPIPEHQPWTCEDLSAFGSRRLGKLIAGRRWELVEREPNMPLAIDAHASCEQLRRRRKARSLPRHARRCGEWENASDFVIGKALGASRQASECLRARSSPPAGKAGASLWRQLADARRPRWPGGCLSSSKPRLMLHGLCCSISPVGPKDFPAVRDEDEAPMGSKTDLDDLPAVATPPSGVARARPRASSQHAHRGQPRRHARRAFSDAPVALDM